MDRNEMLRLFEPHREAEDARDIGAILETFVAEPFLETMSLGLRSEGRDAVRAAYEQVRAAVAARRGRRTAAVCMPSQGHPRFCR